MIYFVALEFFICLSVAISQGAFNLGLVIFPALYLWYLMKYLTLKCIITEFTWWTYFIARRRALKAEALEFSQHMSAFRGPHAFLSRWEFTEALARRYKRERKKHGS